MKITRSLALRLSVASALLLGAGVAQSTLAQNAPTKKAARAPRGKNFTPRMVKATEAQTGKTLTPALKAQLTKALRAREAAIQAANDAYYAEFAKTTGLTVEQAREIDKPTRGKTTTTTGTGAQGQTQTNLGELTLDDDTDDPAPRTPNK